MDKSACKGYTLLLTARKLVRVVIALCVKTCKLEKLIKKLLIRGSIV